jgi:hypothetical protein
MTTKLKIQSSKLKGRSKPKPTRGAQRSSAVAEQLASFNLRFELWHFPLPLNFEL